MIGIKLRRHISEENIMMYYQIQNETPKQEFHVFLTPMKVLGIIDSLKRNGYRFTVLIREGAYHRYELIVKNAATGF